MAVTGNGFVNLGVGTPSSSSNHNQQHPSSYHPFVAFGGGGGGFSMGGKSVGQMDGRLFANNNNSGVVVGSAASAVGAMGGGGGGSSLFDEEGAGLLSKSFSAAKAGATVLAGGASAVATQLKEAAGGVVGGGENNLVVDDGDPFSTGFSFGGLSTQRMFYFALAAGVGSLFMLLAFLFLPMLVFAPSKFALLFTLGSICFMVALGLLKGFNAFFQHLVSYQRLPFTIAYVLSLAATLHSTLMAKSYLLTLLFSIVQIMALISFLVSYIPGGTGVLKFLGSAAWQMLRRICRCQGAREGTPLPL